MTFLLAITDCSTGEGVYTADMVAALAPRLGYSCVAGWDHGLHGWPLLRAAALAAGLTPILGCRFTWRGMEFGAFPHSNRGYAELCRLLTDQAHGGHVPRRVSRRGQGATVGEVVPARGVADLQDGVVVLRWT